MITEDHGQLTGHLTETLELVSARIALIEAGAKMLGAAPNNCIAKIVQSSVTTEDLLLTKIF